MRSRISTETRSRRWRQPFASIVPAQNATEHVLSANRSERCVAETADRARLRARMAEPETRATSLARLSRKFENRERKLRNLQSSHRNTAIVIRGDFCVEIEA
jgi:hypothetical protein